MEDYLFAKKLVTFMIKNDGCFNITKTAKTQWIDKKIFGKIKKQNPDFDFDKLSYGVRFYVDTKKCYNNCNVYFYFERHTEYEDVDIYINEKQFISYLTNFMRQYEPDEEIDEIALAFRDVFGDYEEIYFESFQKLKEKFEK